ncbi:hypothetical protein [uncultured Megasphaera sp.]|uniref:hypothetical protein n=1 Tax=uncultured Megasphaera sp. TaxID=165188 RepID=UPI00266D584E|nr:hypothetical protein [uncultured Megasphaera sp.]
MKKILKGRVWSPSWILAALLLAGLSLGYAWMSYQSFTAWKSLRSQLQVYAHKDFSASAAVPDGSAVDMEGAVSNLIDSHGLTLLSWHQARQGDSQTLMMEGPFASILSWLNDWQKKVPNGSVKVIEWVPTGESTVITVEVSGPPGHTVKQRKMAEPGS